MPGSVWSVPVGIVEGITAFSSLSLLLLLPLTLILCALRCCSVWHEQQLTAHLCWQTVCVLEHTAKKNSLLFTKFLNKLTPEPFTIVLPIIVFFIEIIFNNTPTFLMTCLLMALKNDFWIATLLEWFNQMPDPNPTGAHACILYGSL